MDGIIKRAVIISGSRLLALSMPIISFIILGYFNANEIALHTLATQLIQIAIVVLVMSGVGINFIMGGSNLDKEKLSRCSFGYLFCIGFLCFFIISVYGFGYCSGIFLDIVIILAIGIPFTAGYVANSAILESVGHEGKIFSVSLITSVLNVLVSLPLAFNFPHPAMMVALCTTIIRVSQLFLSMYYIKKYLGFYIKPMMNENVSKDLFKLSISDVITSLAFITSIYFGVVFIKNNFDSSSVAALGVSLSHMNIMSVICISFCVSYIIQLSNATSAFFRVGKRHLKLAFSFFTMLFLFLILLNPFFSFIYNASGSIIGVESFLLLSILVILVDGIAIFINSHLRLNGFRIIPPLFRLTFVFVGIPVGCLLSVQMKDAKYLLVGMVIGNAMSLVLSCLYYHFKLSITDYSNQPG